MSLSVSPQSPNGANVATDRDYPGKIGRQVPIPFTLSTVATQTPETVGAHVDDMGWFQLYPPRDPDLRADIIKRAKDSGFKTLVVTVDIPAPSSRQRASGLG